MNSHMDNLEFSVHFTCMQSLIRINNQMCWCRTCETTLSLLLWTAARLCPGLSVKSSSCGMERPMCFIFARLEPPMPCWGAGCWLRGWAGGGHVVGGTGWATGRRWDLMFMRGGGGLGGGTTLASLKRRGSFCMSMLWAGNTCGISLPCWSTLTPGAVWGRGPWTPTTDSRLLEKPKQAGKKSFLVHLLCRNRKIRL